MTNIATQFCFSCKHYYGPYQVILSRACHNKDYSGIWIEEDRRHPGPKHRVELLQILDTIYVYLVDDKGSKTKINTLKINGDTLTDKDGVESISITDVVITFPNITLTKQGTMATLYHVYLFKRNLLY